MCSKCSRNHWGDCATHACFKCGVTGHYKEDYPQMKRDEQRNRPTLSALPAARVYNLSKADAEASPSVVTCQVSSAGTNFYGLIDSSATHSIGAARAVDRLCRPCDISGSSFRTLLPTGELVVSRRWVRSLPLVINGRELHVDLIELDLEDFDMILGMDWLVKYGSTIDYTNKLVTFKPAGEDPCVFQGSRQKSCIPLVSASRTRD